MEETLIEKVRQRSFLYDTKSPDYRDQQIRANAWEGIGKVFKIKRKFYEGNSISKLQIQVATYVFELSAGNCNH
jgi:hypothetical protein